jgi:hypothetical protein
MKPALLLSASLVLAALLSGCSERVIATANDDLLIVVEDIERSTPLATATVHYVMSSPQPLSGDSGPAGRVVRMRQEGRFDCAGRRWGESLQELTMLDGQTLTNQTPEPVLRAASSGSIGESALRAVCDQAFYGARASRRPLRSIEKDYLKRAGGR